MLRISYNDENEERSTFMKSDQMVKLNRELPKLLRKVFGDRVPPVVIDLPVIVIAPKIES